MNDDYEVVYTMTDFWNGPRKGIANYQGRPHLYQSEYRYAETESLGTFLLMPIDLEVLALALEGWEIWRRWKTAFHSGETSIDTHPALPQDRPRYTELQALLNGRLEIDPNRAFRVEADFRRRDDPAWNSKGWAPLEVRWSMVAER